MYLCDVVNKTESKQIKNLYVIRGVTGKRGLLFSAG